MKKGTKRKLIDQSGQALIETVVLFPLVASCFILCLLFFNVYAQQLWMDHQLYQSLVCMAKGHTSYTCEKKMKKKIKSFLWAGRLEETKLYKKANKWQGTFVWRTQFWRIPFRKTFELKKF